MTHFIDLMFDFVTILLLVTQLTSVTTWVVLDSNQ